MQWMTNPSSQTAGGCAFMYEYGYVCIGGCECICSCYTAWANFSLSRIPPPAACPSPSSPPSLVPPVSVLISVWKLLWYQLRSKACLFLPLFSVPSQSDRILCLITFTLPTCLCLMHPTHPLLLILILSVVVLKHIPSSKFTSTLSFKDGTKYCSVCFLWFGELSLKR